MEYISVEVRNDTISIAVMDFTGKVVMESVRKTEAATSLQFVQGKYPLQVL